MAKIFINEKDLTAIPNTSENASAVYIPGYANMGPVNTPTLVSSVTEFQSIFGSVPYKFTESQTLPTFTSYTSAAIDNNNIDAPKQGDIDKSYIYAYELLSAGIPVVYERVNAQDVNVLTMGVQLVINNLSYAIAAPFVGKAGQAYKISKFTYTANSDDTKTDVSLHIFVDKNNYGIPEFDSDVTFTFTNDTAAEHVTIAPENSDFYIQLIKYIPNVASGRNIIVSDASALQGYTSGELSEATQFSHKDAESTAEFNLTNYYNFVTSGTFFSRLADKATYPEIGFITTGGYPIFEAKGTTTGIEDLLSTAATRNDSTALIDYIYCKGRALGTSIGDNSVYNSLKACIHQIGSKVSTPLVNAEVGESISKYGAMYIGYGYFNDRFSGTTILMPTSFSYLMAYARAISMGPSYYAVAGLERGIVPGMISLAENVTQSLANQYNPDNDVSANGICKVRLNGIDNIVIWGNRTSFDNSTVVPPQLTDSSFMNIRQMITTIKKKIFEGATTTMFSPNDLITWLKFKSILTPILDEMVQNRGLETYTLNRVATTKKATIAAKLVIYPIEAVENFTLDIELQNNPE